MATRRVNALRGLLAASALMALLLIATAAWSYVSIRGNVADLARGRGTFLCDVLRDDLESLTPGPPDLKGLLSRNQNLGISWIGRVNPDGDVLDEAGTRPAAWLMYTGDEFQIVGNLAVVTMPPPHQDPAPKGGVARERPARSADGAPPLCLSDDPRCGSDGQLEPEPRLELAYALTAANDLLHRSEEALGVAIAGAVLLMGGTGISWRALKRAEAAEASLQRHRQLAELGQVFAVLAH